MRKLITILIVATVGLVLILTLPSRSVIYEAEPIEEPQTPWEFAADQVTEKWGVTHLNAFYRLVHAESQWNPEAQNPHSSAYGLGQLLDSTWESTGYEKSSDPEIQVLATIAYIEGRYGDPVTAWQVWQKQHWY